MLRILLSLGLVIAASTYAAAETKKGDAKKTESKKTEKKAPTVSVTGCNYAGLLGCRYLRTAQGRIYQLDTASGVQLPPADRIVTATGTVTPRGLGICGGTDERLTATRIAASRQACKGPK